ncbi:unnamed protein product, partial [Symbiodinium necroappetens]
DPSCLAWALRKMEAAWGEEEHLAKLSVNALIGLWARNVDLVYLMCTSNNQLDGNGCQYRQTFVDAAGNTHWDHPAGFCDGGGVLRGGPDPAAAGGGAHALPEVLEDRLPGLPNERENRRLAPADAVVIEHAHRARPRPDASHPRRAELLRHTRLCHAITYASCQGLTLRGRVWLLDCGTQHFNLRHLYVGASKATSSELLSVL